MSTMKKIACSAAAAVAAATAFTLTVPTGTAFAIDHVECRRGENFLKIWSHIASGSEGSTMDCYANRGKTSFGPFGTGAWVDRISTGNNDMIYYDANGASVRINRWTDISFPNNSPRVKAIRIL